MEEMKKKGLGQPSYASKANLSQKETGLREETKTKDLTLEHLETQSEAQSQLTLGGDFNEGDATEAQLIKEKHRLEETVARLNIEIKNKNEKILELLESIEDFKI